MAFRRISRLLAAIALAGCVQGGEKLPPDQVRRYDGLYVAKVERLGGTPVYCDTNRVESKPWLIVNGEIRFRQNAYAGFSVPIAPDLTFYKAITGSFLISGHLTNDGLEAETSNPFVGYECHFKFTAKRVLGAFPDKSPFDGVYKGYWQTTEDKNAQDFGRVMNGGCASVEEKTINVRPTYVSSTFSSSDVVAAPLREDGTFEREQGGWKFSGSIQSGIVKATVSNQTCTVTIEAKKT